MSDKDRFILRLNPTRRARWDRARGNLALSTWIKLLCDNAADATLGKGTAPQPDTQQRPA
jgi:hypothetical protein